MASDCLIRNVRDYRDAQGMRRFVTDLLRAHPQIDERLRAASSSTLVVVKPNWVQESHEFEPETWLPVITHPDLLLAIIEVVAEHMNGRGTISVCDAPNTYADFPSIARRGDFAQRYHELRARWPGLTLESTDLRREVWIVKEQVVVERRPNPPDPRGYVAYDLGRDSLFYGHHGEGRYYGADYESAVVNEHHNGETHEYLLAGTPAVCDVFINVPKLKTHKKTGITCCLKNLVGINGDKNWLPHHTEGTPESGGDEYPAQSFSQELETQVKKLGRRVALSTPVLGPWLYRKLRNTGIRVLGDSRTVVRNGNWSGNDTCWRMALDLNRAFLYGNPDGTIRDDGVQRPYLAIVDGIIGGQGDGPLCPDAIASGVLLAGSDPAAVDALAARLIGFELERLAMVTQAFASHRYPIARVALDEVRVMDERVGRELGLHEVAPAVAGGFAPHFGWRSAAA